MRRLRRAAVAAAGAVALAVAANELTGRPVYLLRWSVIRFFLGGRRLMTEWRVGDGREERLADHVCRHARPGDVHDVVRVIDDFCLRKSFMMSVGPEKGAILDRAVARVRPRRVLELGTYCGYSALRLLSTMPADGRLVTVEFSAQNARTARRIVRHAGADDRITVLHGTLADDEVRRRLEVEHGVGDGVDLLFLDHAKEEYLPDLRTVVGRGWLRVGTVVLADNVGFRGARAYRAHVRSADGGEWATVEHRTHIEHQSLVPDRVAESTYRGPGGGVPGPADGDPPG